MSLAPDTYICPVTKLPILNKPEWHKVGFGNEFKISADIIGGQILLTHNFGSPTLHDVQNTLARLKKIINTRNEKARIYWNSLRPNRRVSLKNEKEKREDAGNRLYQ